MYILSNMWFSQLMKHFFFWIDKIVYNFIPYIYDLLISIARTSVLTQSDIIEMADRIYKLLAIFMVFKVTLSLITYVVNPDDLSDKSKGVSKLGINIVLSLSLLILTPYIFNYAYQLQTIVLEDNSLASLVFGDEYDEEESFFNTAGEDISFVTMSAFFAPQTTLDGMHECITLVENGSFNSRCQEAMLKYTENDNPYFKESTLKNYIEGVKHNSLGLMFRQEMVEATTNPEDPNDREFIMDYRFVFSTAVGVCEILLLITFCMDIAVRSIKLAFLQLAAPIPIISYIDPKSGKDGLFKKWYQMCFKTYISLFSRLLALYFAVYVISKVADLKMVDIINGSYQTNMLVKVFIIIGALMFANQLPKILEGLGIKLDGGGFTLNPLKKFEKEAIGGKQISGFTRGAIGAVGAMGASTVMGTIGAMGNVKSRWAETAKGDRFGLLMGGLTSGISRGLKAGGKGFSGAFHGEKMGKNFTNSYSHAKKTETERFDRLSDGVSALEVAGAKVQNSFGMRTKGKRAEIASEAYKKANESYSSARDMILAADDQAKSLNEQLKILDATPVDRNKFYDANNNFDDVAYMNAVRAHQATKKKINDQIDNRVKDIMAGSEEVVSGGGPNETATRAVKELNKSVVEYTEKGNRVAGTVDSNFAGATADADDPKKTAKRSQTASTAIGSSEEVIHSKAVDKYAGTKKDK